MKPPYKILIFTLDYGEPSQTFVSNEIHSLHQDQRLEIQVLTLRNASENQPDYVKVIPFPRDLGKSLWKKGIRFLYRKAFQSGWFLPFKSKKFGAALDAEIEEFQPDLIHIHFGSAAAYIFQNTGGVNRIPTLTIFRGYDASKLLNLKAYRQFLKKLLTHPMASTMSVAHSLRQNLEKRIIAPRNHYILYSGTDTDFYTRKSYHHQKNPPRFLQISRFHEKKGHLITLRAFALFKKNHPKKDFKLIFAGDGEFKEKAIRLSKELNLQNHVEFIGWVTKKQARELMEKSHFFVHHSITPKSGDQEGIPNAIMEAMAMELPILASEHSGIPELVTDEINGYLVPEKDIKAYAESIAKIIDWDYTKENREKVMLQFEKSKHKENLIAIYQNVLNKHNSSPQV